jgi:hypothetical protein
MPIEPSNPRLQRMTLRAAAVPPSRYLFRSIHTPVAIVNSVRASFVP